MAPTILVEYLIEYHSSALIKLDGRAQQSEQQLAQTWRSFFLFSFLSSSSPLKLLLRNKKRSAHQSICMESLRGQRDGESSAQGRGKQAVEVLKNFMMFYMGTQGTQNYN